MYTCIYCQQLGDQSNTANRHCSNEQCDWYKCVCGAIYSPKQEKWTMQYDEKDLERYDEEEKSEQE